MTKRNTTAGGGTPMSRRRFLRDAALAGAGGLALGAGACSKRSGDRGRKAESRPAGRGPSHAILSEDEYAAVSAVCQQILPADEDPGAIELGVPDYVDWALSIDDIPGSRDAVREGLQELDAQARKSHRTTLADAAPEVQQELLASWQRSGDEKRVRFVRLMIELTMEGAFGHPMYGGNKGGAGWDLIGFATDKCSFDLIAAAGRKRP